VTVSSVYSHLPSIDGGHLLHPKSEEWANCGDRDHITLNLLPHQPQITAIDSPLPQDPEI
jgi:hypothetical protein